MNTVTKAEEYLLNVLMNNNNTRSELPTISQPEGPAETEAKGMREGGGKRMNDHDYMERDKDKALDAADSEQNTENNSLIPEKKELGDENNRMGPTNNNQTSDNIKNGAENSSLNVANESGVKKNKEDDESNRVASGRQHRDIRSCS